MDLPDAPLAPDVAAGLWRRVADGDAAARETLIHHNLGLIVLIAKRVLPLAASRGLELGDLIAEGYFGLAKAVDRFNLSRGVQFSTYAVHYLRRYMLRSFIRARFVRLPDTLAEQVRRAMGDDGEPSPIASRLVRRAMVTHRLAPQVPEGSPENRFVDRADPAAAAEAADERERVGKLLGRLSRREAAVIRARFGLGGGGEELDSKDIGRRLKIPADRVGEIERQALAKLKGLLLAAA